MYARIMDASQNNPKIYEIHFNIILCSTSIYFPRCLLCSSGFLNKILINSASLDGKDITLSCNYVTSLQRLRHDKPIDIKEICAETWGFSTCQISALQIQSFSSTLNMNPNTKFWRDKIMDSPK